MKVLVCGGAGYIGSHACVELLANGHEVIIFDNFHSGSVHLIEAVGIISGRHIKFVHGDIRNIADLRRVFSISRPDAVMNFAALKYVGESFSKPIDYFETNISGTINLLKCMVEVGVIHLIHSSSASVYGDQESCPITEEAPLRITSPYGRSKLISENIIGEVCNNIKTLKFVILRYFNPIGAHSSGLIGNCIFDAPGGLISTVSKVALGVKSHLKVYGYDYKTKDGTGVRDYIHVVDLARAHVSALSYLESANKSLTVNLGTGKGSSVLELVSAFERASGRSIPFRMELRRHGDVAESYASSELAHRALGWRAEFDLNRMCVDEWRWQLRNVNSPGNLLRQPADEFIQ